MKTINVFRVNGTEAFDLEVVGESYYQDIFAEIVGKHGEEGVDILAEACLMCEPDNPHDKNAVKVTISEKTVGYLPRQSAKDFQKLLKLFDISIDSQFIFKANIRGGFKKEDESIASYGIWLDFPDDEEYAISQFRVFSKNKVHKKKTCCLLPLLW